MEGWPPPVPVPDPVAVRVGILDDIAELGFPAPPDGYPLVWESGDAVRLRPVRDLLARCAVLDAVVAGSSGAPPELTCGWLTRNGLREAATGPEWAFLSARHGPSDLYGLHVEAVEALRWVLGAADDLDPSRYAGDGAVAWLPDLRADEPFDAWCARVGARPRPPDEVAALLDLHYCLDAGHVQAVLDGGPHPGVTLPYVVGQRRWALDWATVFTGPYHAEPPRWDEVDLAS